MGLGLAVYVQVAAGRALATIKSQQNIDGHVIDCVDVNKQPAFRHPLLVNHTLQMKPTYHPTQTRVNDHVMEASYPWNLSKRCPEGSIPIERTQRNGHLSGSNPRADLLQEYSIALIRGTDIYNGGKGSINVWNPKVENPKEYSTSQIWVASEYAQTTLEAGWMVYPQMYGGNKTRFFISWTTDDYLNGCFNLDCPGFVQTNRSTILSTYLQPVSVYGGPQYSVDVEIHKDKKTGNWWVFLQGAAMGYWPKQLVPSLADGADNIRWGGEVGYLRSRGHTSTQMGSGHFPNEGFNKSSFFKNIQYLDGSYAYRDVVDTRLIANSPKCYDLHVGENKSGPWKCFFFYGGPGKSQSCP